MDYTDCYLLMQKHGWSNLLHPLHLVTDKVKWITRFGSCDSPLIISLLKRDGSQQPSLFVVLHLDNCPQIHVKVDCNSIDNISKDENNMYNMLPTVFLCSEEFLNHYHPFTKSENLVFTCVSAFPLERVIIAAQTNETFQWAKQQSFETGLLVASTCNRSLLLRCGDVVLSPPLSAYGCDRDDLIKKFNELVVVESTPVQQGVITINTTILVINPEEIVKSFEEQCGEVSQPRKFHVALFDDEFHSFGGSPSGWNIKTTKNSLSVLYCSQSTAKELDLKNDDFVVVTLPKYPEDINACDIENDILKDSMERIFILQSVPDEKFCHHVNDIILKDDNLLCCSLCQSFVKMSSTSWFNLVGEERFHFLQRGLFTVQLRKLDGIRPSFARDIHLAMVLSPNYTPSGCYDKSLMNFFKEKQLVKVGDVVSITVEGDYDFYEAADTHSHRCRVVYYQVKNLETTSDPCKFFFVDTKHTTFYQDGTINSYIPSLLYNNKESVSLKQDDVASAGLSKYLNELQNLVAPYFLKSSVFDYPCSVLLSGPCGCGKRSIINNLCGLLHLHLVYVDCQSLVSDTPGASEAKINEAFRRASVYTPCVIVLSMIDSIGINRETNRVDDRVAAALQKAISNLPRQDGSNYPAVVIATTTDKANVTSEIRMMFLHQVDMESPDEEDRLAMLMHTSNSLTTSRDVNYRWIAKHTAGFVYGDFWELMRKTVQATHERIIDKCAVGTKLTWKEEEYLAMAGVTSVSDDIVKALHQMQSERADNIGVPKIPDVHWQDIGGLEEVKSHILDTIQLPLDHPELFSTGLRRSGVLLYGPPGTGKTLLAKAVASQCSLSFLSVKGPELINMYVGQSEANVRRVFQRARDAAPCVVFFDELDALAPNRGRSGDSGGVMDRVVSQLLAELDGVNSSAVEDKQVFVIAASNRPDLIDQALLRPGRFDKLLYVGISESKGDKLKVLYAQTRKMNLSPDVDLEAVVKLCPPNMTGADFYGLTSEAAMNAVRRRIQTLESGNNDEGPCTVEQIDLIHAANNAVSSVDDDQLRNYRRVKSTMSR